MWRLIALAAAVCFGLAPPVRADHALVLHPLGQARVRVDGDLGEWRGVAFAEVGDQADGSLEYALAFDEASLVVGLRVYDDHFVRVGGASRRQDAVVLRLAMPTRSGRVRSTHLWLLAGRPGSRPSEVRVSAGDGGSKPLQGIEVVEGPLQQGPGYVLEARIPWRLVPGAVDWHHGRGAISLYDVDAEGDSPRRLSSAQARRPAALPYLRPVGGAVDGLASLVRSQGLESKRPRFDLIGDVRGDRRQERVVLIGSFVVVLGVGAEYQYAALPVSSASDLRAARLVDLSADGKAELLLSLRQRAHQGSRHLTQVLDLSAAPRAIFAVETRRQTPLGWAESDLELVQYRGAPALRLHGPRAEGLPSGTSLAPPMDGAEPLLLPWGAQVERIYAFVDGRMARVSSRENPDRIQRDNQAPTSKPQGTAGVTQAGPSALVSAFRNARGLDPEERPRFLRKVNVAEDRRRESIMVLGTHLLVLGEGFRAGQGYLFLGLPVQQGEDVLRLFTGDVTGDGRREVFARIRQRVGEVKREILLGYTLGEGQWKQIVGVEVRRASGDSSVGNLVALVPEREHWALEIKPGRARGWDARSYPFGADGLDAYGSPLLPWVDRTVRYTFVGGALRQR